MKCQKCGSEVKPNYKFCTKCGQPMDESVKADAGFTGNNSHEEIPDNGEKFLGLNFGRRTQSSRRDKPSGRSAQRLNNAVEEIDIVRGKAIWNIGPGQLARRVTETEFSQLDDLKGVVIQQGVAAIVSVDGQIMGMLEGGYYEFASKSVKEKASRKAEKQEAEEKEDEGFLAKAGRTARRVWRFFTGKSHKEKNEDRKRRRERIRKNIQRITSKSVVNVTLVNTRIFEVLFGSSIDSQGYPVFEPILVKTQVVDLSMGVSLQMQVSDINKFLVNYLSDRSSISVLDIQRLLLPSVENILSRLLRNFDYQKEGLPEELTEIIKKQVTVTINERVHGLEVVQILDITDKSEDFDRFRAVEYELFASEHELGFLHRTGEFRNRLAIESNAQAIQQARNEEDLRYALAQVNRDELLHDDEMEAFVELLSCQRQLREAQNEEQIYEALANLRKCRLVKDDDVAALEHLLLHNQIKRDEASELLRIQVFQNTEEARRRAEIALSDMALSQQILQENRLLQHQFESELSAARHDVDMTGLGIQSRSQIDEYNRRHNSMEYDFFQRRRLDEITIRERRESFAREQRRADKFDDIDILERKASIASQNMMRLQAHEQRMEELRRQAEIVRIQTEATMSQEQIAASHMADISSLDSNAQAEMAKMMSSGKTTEVEMLRQQQEKDKLLYERMVEMQKENLMLQVQQGNLSQQQMAQMMQSMMSAMAQMGQNATFAQQAQFAQQQAFQQQRYDDMTMLKNEYRDDAIRQQQRIDHTQNAALDYTTRQGSHSSTIFCHSCCAKIPESARVCPQCGEPVDK